MELKLQNVVRLKERVKACGAGARTQGTHVRRYLSDDQSAGSLGTSQWFFENPSLLDVPMYVCVYCSVVIRPHKQG